MLLETDPHQRAKRLFNTIAPAYSLLDEYVKSRFSTAMRCIAEEVPVEGRSVLDVGSGTGAWAALFKAHGASNVHGVDFAHRMVQMARKKYHPDIHFSVGDAQNLGGFADGTFDIVTASFVLHGMKQAARKRILQEMRRISIRHVIIHDYYGPTPLFARFLEFLERSDYLNFKEHFYGEFQEIFPTTTLRKVAGGTSVYLARQ